MDTRTFLIGFACAALLTSCASVPLPAELANARQAYAHASAGPAAQLVPAHLHKAREALARAEESFRDDPKSYRTRDPANLAGHEAKIAEAFATAVSDSTIAAKANKDFWSTKPEIVKER